MIFILEICCIVHEKMVLKSASLEVKELMLSEPVDPVGGDLPTVTVDLEEGQKRGFKVDTDLLGKNAFGVTYVKKGSCEWDAGVRVGHKLKYINGAKPSLDLYENSQNRDTSFRFGPWEDNGNGRKRDLFTYRKFDVPTLIFCFSIIIFRGLSIFSFFQEETVISLNGSFQIDFFKAKNITLFLVNASESSSNI